MSSWYGLEVPLNSLSPEEKESLLFELFEQNGVYGIEEQERGIQIFLESEEGKEAVLSLLTTYALTPTNCTHHKENEWVQYNPEILAPATVGKFLITPFASNPDRAPAPNEILLVPGTGFGSGHHQSTQRALLLLQSLVDRHSQCKKILDVGTGSGLLAVGAYLLFKSDIVATDIDPFALENAENTFALNNIKDEIVLLPTSLPAEKEGTFDLILANLYGELLLELRHALFTRSSPKGFLILSGIVPELFHQVKAEYSALGWTLLEEFNEGDWCAVLFQRG